jgi:Na+/melibiose symporter-like transporter
MGIVLIPYEALGAELTPDHEDRSTLQATYYFACVTGILVAIVSPSFVSDEKTGYFVLGLIFSCVFALGCFSVAAKLKESPVHEDNPPAVPSMVNCLRNPVFRILLLNQLIEAIGANTQFTVISFVVAYVIDPEYNADGSQRVNADWTEDQAFLMLGGGLLLFELLSIPLWLKLAQSQGKFNAYLYWNIFLCVSTGCKVFIGKDDVILGMLLAIFWGIGNGGSQFLLRSILADVYDYDQVCDHRCTNILGCSA